MTLGKAPSVPKCPPLGDEVKNGIYITGWLGRMDDNVCKVLSIGLVTEDKLMELLSPSEP